MSPLQYQKWLRLNEARRLMLNEGFDAASVAFKVGYESASQFSREYARLFGAPSKRDVAISMVSQPYSAASRMLSKTNSSRFTWRLGARSVLAFATPCC